MGLWDIQDQLDWIVKYDLVNNISNGPITRSTWILALPICFPTATSDDVSCPLLVTK